MDLKKTESSKLLRKHFGGIDKILGMKPQFQIFAGPCAVESYEQMEAVAEELVRQNIKIMRAGAFKPRTSPHDFQGLEEEGLKILSEIGKKYQLITVSEIMDARHAGLFEDTIDVIQIGARNMQNFSLLKEVGKMNKPVILKRGFSSTVKELICAAEYIVKGGNEQIILCERGIRTFETCTRSTLDISCVAIIKEITSFPIIVDISHSLGRKDIIIPVARAMKEVGADGIMVEVHPDPKEALSDKDQQLNFEEFGQLINNLEDNL